MKHGDLVLLLGKPMVVVDVEGVFVLVDIPTYIDNFDVVVSKAAFDGFIRSPNSFFALVTDDEVDNEIFNDLEGYANEFARFKGKTRNTFNLYKNIA